MKLKLEQLGYQQKAIESVLSVFKGQGRNNYQNSCKDGIRSNTLVLNSDDIQNNIKSVINKNGIDESTAKLSIDNDLCIEMETGTGKTLVYIKTIYEMYKDYGFTKFLIIVPSIAIKEGVLSAFDTFKEQLEDIYNVRPDLFDYNSKRLSKVKNFIEEQHPQVMVITLQSFNSEDRILNQEQREDLFSNIPFIEAIAKTRPIIIMDEPQEGMDTDNSIESIKKLNPLYKIRYSATHKVMKNLIYRLSPFDSYKQGLVKKIEVLTVSEKNDEASMKIELFRIDLGKGEPKAILKAWHKTANEFKFKNTNKLEKDTNLFEITGNVIYSDYSIDQIAKPIRGRGYVKFKNGAVIYEGEQAKDCSIIFGEQLYWLIDTHFIKRDILKDKGIKCLSLIFIDRVDNYILSDGIIRKAFSDQYKKVCMEHFGKEPAEQEIIDVQGYYFAQTGKGDFTDNKRSMESNKELYDLILKDKERLLSIDNPVEFIFSHSALGVGWDNPNIFNIATLNQSYSEIKKRQEIGRGLRICVNQNGHRVYDSPTTPDDDLINLLTIVPNETYTTFVSQYQSEIIEIYGTSKAGAVTSNKHKGKRISEKKIKRNDDLFNSASFREFWNRLSKKTEYLIDFDEDSIIGKCINALNEIKIPEHVLEMSLDRIERISENEIDSKQLGRESRKSNIQFQTLDLIEEISENTSLAYPTVFKIVKGIPNRNEIIKNPPRFIQEAVTKIKFIELEEMYRALQYKPTGESFDIDLFEKIVVKNTNNVQATPNRGIYQYIVYDSDIEQRFAAAADDDTEVVCFLKLPAFYKIETPIGTYNPDFGLVLKRKKIRDKDESEFYFVIETKGTNSIDDHKALTDDEIYKIKCAIKHFTALGIESKVDYIAPVKEYSYFKDKSEAYVNGQSKSKTDENA